MYAGAAIGFYGSRALFALVIMPIVTKVAPEGGTGFSDPNNYKEVTDIAVAAVGVAMFKDVNMKRGIMAGAALSLTDHLLDRFPEVAAKIPGR